MKHFLIVTNDGKDREYKVTDHVKNLLEQAGMTCVICEKDENKQIIREAEMCIRDRFWIVPYIYELFESIKRLFSL